jgi:hypothetical protein
MSSSVPSRSVVESSAPPICRATARALAVAALLQGVREQVRGVQRLQQVVADRGEEAALGVVGALGLALGGSSIAVRSPTRCSRVSLMRLRPVSAWRNAVTSVKVATKPPPGIGLPRISTMLPSGNTALGQVRGAGTHVRQAALAGRHRRSSACAERTQRPLRGLGDRHAHPQHAGREAEQFGVAAIPGHQPQLAHRPR